jgi:hypothetical protein
MKITLSLDDALVKKVRKIALERDTTLTGMVRDYLERLVEESASSSRRKREREALEQTSIDSVSASGNEPPTGRTCMPGPDFLVFRD